MNFNEFCELVGKIYDELPKEISDKFSVNVEEIPCEFSSKEHPFGYWTSMFPENITLCWWVFKDHRNFSKDHIERVIKHEVEHLLLTRFGLKHSEHDK